MEAQMPRGYVNRILLTTLYRDLCSASEEHQIAQTDRGSSHNQKLPRVDKRADLHRQLCFFHQESYAGQRDGFLLFSMPSGTAHEGWMLAVPRNRADKMWKGPVRALYGGYVVRYPESHYAYPIVKGRESDIIETDDIQHELLDALYHELLPVDTAAHWVRMGRGRKVRVKLHGLNSSDVRETIACRVVMRDYWNDQYFTTNEGRERIFLGDVHPTTMCRITAVLGSDIRDMATDGSKKAKSRALHLGDEWFECRHGHYGPAIDECTFITSNGVRYPYFQMRCETCGDIFTPPEFREMNKSIKKYAFAQAELGGEAFRSETPRYNVLRNVNEWSME